MESMKSPNRNLWEETITEELEWLEEEKPRYLSKDQKRKRLLPYKFVLKFKLNYDGSIERHISRLVILGNLQLPDVEFFDKYETGGDLKVMRVLLCMIC